MLSCVTLMGRWCSSRGRSIADGSIVGNDNDADPLRFEPHYSEITSPQQVEIYEPILKDSEGRVTTGLLHAVGYLKDNRLLPTGFNKSTAEKDIAVTGTRPTIRILPAREAWCATRCRRAMRKAPST